MIASKFVDTGRSSLRDINRLSGLTGWVQELGVPERKLIVEKNRSDAGLRRGLETRA
jgi:hypothetical protein